MEGPMGRFWGPDSSSDDSEGHNPAVGVGRVGEEGSGESTDESDSDIERRYIPVLNLATVTTGGMLSLVNDDIINNITVPLNLDIGDGGDDVILRVIHTDGHFLVFWPVLTIGGSRVEMIFRFLDLYFVAYLPPVPQDRPHILDISPPSESRKVEKAFSDLGFHDLQQVGVGYHYTSLSAAGSEHRARIYLGRSSIDQQIELLRTHQIYETDRPAFSTSVTSICQFSSEVWRLKGLRAHVEVHYTAGENEVGVTTPEGLVIEEHGWAATSLVLQGRAHDVLGTNFELRREPGSPILSFTDMFDMVGALRPYGVSYLREANLEPNAKIFRSKYIPPPE